MTTCASWLSSDDDNGTAAPSGRSTVRTAASLREAALKTTSFCKIRHDRSQAHHPA